MMVMIKVDDTPLLTDFTDFDTLFPRINGSENIVTRMEVRGSGVALQIVGMTHYIKPGQKLTFEFQPGA